MKINLRTIELIERPTSNQSFRHSEKTNNPSDLPLFNEPSELSSLSRYTPTPSALAVHRAIKADTKRRGARNRLVVTLRDGRGNEREMPSININVLINIMRRLNWPAFIVSSSRSFNCPPLSPSLLPLIHI